MDPTRKNIQLTTCGLSKTLTFKLPEKITDHTLIKRHLIKWLKEKAMATLSPRLQALSLVTGLQVTQIKIGQQKTLWGSCNRHAEINLNMKLLFLPPRLVDYILIHELCHIAHFNHSKRFWAKVAKFDPNYHAHRHEIKKADQLLPDFLV